MRNAECGMRNAEKLFCAAKSKHSTLKNSKLIPHSALRIPHSKNSPYLPAINRYIMYQLPATRFKVLIFLVLFSQPLVAQQSIAREWSESLLQTMQEDLARPHVQARNIFHLSVVLYDAWAAYDLVTNEVVVVSALARWLLESPGVAIAELIADVVETSGLSANEVETHLRQVLDELIECSLLGREGSPARSTR